MSGFHDHRSGAPVSPGRYAARRHSGAVGVGTAACILWMWLAGFGGGATVWATDPLLLFVGEDLSSLSVASRRPESPERAPAIVSVVTAHDIKAKGYRTLADVLRHEAGFVVRPGERGSTPYLRGIREGILFLYDGVPLHVNVTKSVHPLDEEISLQAVERVEIVRGPGSVLWGADAYAGIVNIVPRRGTAETAGRIAVEGGTQRSRGVYGALSGGNPSVQGFVSLYGQRYRFWNDTYRIPEPSAVNPRETIDDSEDYELVASLNVGDWLSLTGRLADHTHRFLLQDPEKASWPGEKRAPVRFLKVSARKRLGLSDVHLNAYYQNVPLTLTDVDLKRTQKTDLMNAEVLWHRPVGSVGVLTLGAGYQKEKTSDAVIRDGFLPDFLKPYYKVFVPRVEQKDFDNALRSLFAQWRAPWGPVEWWAGLRLDDPQAYASNVSVTAGINWSPAEHWRLKVTYGTAYRHPYAQQLFADHTPPSENIQTAAVELAWTRNQTDQVRLSLFHNTIHDHVQEDPFAGLSQPSDHRIMGAELSGYWRIRPDWKLSAFATALMDNDRPVLYRTPSAVFRRPDGSQVTIYDQWAGPLDTGSDWALGASLQWRLSQAWTMTAETVWTGPYASVYNKGRRAFRWDGDRTVRAHLAWNDAWISGSTLELTLENMLNQMGSVPGIFGPLERPPWRLWVQWSLSF